jgi:DNA-binding response OmpR family regulator
LRLFEQSTGLTLLAIETTIVRLLVMESNKTIDAETLCEAIAANRENEPISRRALENIISRLRLKFKTFAPTESSPLIRAARNNGYHLCLPIVLINTDAR